MSIFLDSSVGFGPETTWGQPVVVSRFPEFVSETMALNKKLKQGKGLRVGSRVDRSARRVQVGYDATGDVTMEAFSKGQGLLWQWMMGAGTSTLISGTAYQQVFTLADVMPSMTMQVGLPTTGGTTEAYTYAGAQCTGFDLTFNQSDLIQVKATVDAQSLATATAYAPPSYVVGGSLFSFEGFALSTGTLTEPTSTALASATSPIANVQSGNITVGQTQDVNRYLAGNAGLKSRQLINGVRTIGGTLTVEYTDSTLAQAIINETPMSLVLTWKTATSIGTGLFETLQVVVPEIKLDGDLPQSNAGQLITHPVKFAGLDNLTATQPIWVVCQTADAAL